MTRISPRRLPTRQKNLMFFLFWKTLADFKRPRDLEFLTKDLFSPTEKVMIAKRFMIALLLHRGLSFRRIGQVLKVSANTVNSIAQKINKRSFGYGTMIKALLNHSAVQRILKSFV